MTKLRYGHAPGHVRDTAHDAFRAWLAWDDGPEPTVSYESSYTPRLIPISKALGLVWNCTDMVPGYLFDHLQEAVSADEPVIKHRTYGACARALVENIKSRRQSV